MLDNLHTIKLANGNLYLDYAVYDTYFRGIDNVVLLSKHPFIHIMPVYQKGAGGLLLKIRNARGDRVVNAIEFFENNGVDVFEERVFPVVWDNVEAALVFSLH